MHTRGSRAGAAYLFATGATATVLAVLASGLGLFALGAATTVITGRSVLRSGMRQLLIGWAAAAVTYGVAPPSA